MKGNPSPCPSAFSGTGGLLPFIPGESGALVPHILKQTVHMHATICHLSLRLNLWFSRSLQTGLAHILFYHLALSMAEPYSSL